jgi:hypothetical protein
MVNILLVCALLEQHMALYVIVGIQDEVVLHSGWKMLSVRQCAGVWQEMSSLSDHLSWFQVISWSRTDVDTCTPLQRAPG